jgi:hypothetical protein
VRPQATGVLLALIGAATAAGAQTKRPVTLPPPTTYSAPTPTPLAPPTNPGPAVVPPDGLSPILTLPGPVYRLPERPSPSYPSAPVPAPVDQQKMQSYRNDLVNQRWQLDRQGVSPDSERYREIQRQLNQPSSR